MKERQILYKGSMVRAILEDRKTNTRRLADRDLAKASGCPHALEFFHQEGKWFYADNDGLHPFASELVCRHGQPGDRLWVKETHARIHEGLLQHLDPDPHSCHWQTVYRADGDPANWRHYGLPWKPSIFMRREYSRITLEITDVRIERLQDISEDDALAEGIFKTVPLPSGESLFLSDPQGTPGKMVGGTAIEAYALLWESINGPGSWDENPLVWAISFKRIV